MKKLIQLIFLVPVMISGCSHFYYVAPVQNVPLFSEAKEIRVSAHAGMSGEAVSGQLQGALAITDKIGIMTNLFFGKGLLVYEDSNGNGLNADIGAGYYKPSGKHSIFEIYGGTGFGYQHHSYRNENYDAATASEIAGKASLSSFKLFVQPSLGWKFKGFETAMSVRFNSLTFLDVRNNISWYLNSHEYDLLNSVEAQKSYFFFEPALTIRFGSKNVKVQLQGIAESYMNDYKTPFDQYQVNAGLFCSF